MRNKLKPKNISDKNLVLLLSVLAFLYFSTISIVRHLSLNSRGFDLGLFDQAIWNVTRGNSLFCTIKYSNGGNLLGDHFEPILFFIAPLYLICSNVLVLVILQSFLIASALIPLYLIARSAHKDKFVIFSFLACFILSKPLRGILINDFHPESFIIPAIFWGYYFLIRRNNVLLSVSIVILLLCKEDTTLLVLGFGLFALLIQKRTWTGISLIMSACLLWVIETMVIIPSFSPTHAFEYYYYFPFGVTYSDNLRFCITHPILFTEFIFLKTKILYILGLFCPLCFLSFLSPPHFILFFIPLLKNLLSSQNDKIFSFTSYYTAGIIPFVFISAIDGCHALLQKLKTNKKNVIVGLLLIGFTLLFLDNTDGRAFSKFINNMRFDHTLEKIKLLGQIPPDASVIATSTLCPHLSHRKYIYVWDPNGDQTIFPQYIAIDKAMFINKYLRPKKMLILDNYLSAAKSKGYEVICTYQNNDFMILASSKR